VLKEIKYVVARQIFSLPEKDGSLFAVLRRVFPPANTPVSVCPKTYRPDIR
jgi:hypothetical protein